MKSTSRLHVQNSPKSPAPQASARNGEVRKSQTPKTKFPAVKSPFGKSFGLKRTDPDPLCLCVFNRELQMPAQKIPISDSEFNQVWETAFKAGSGVEEFVASAVREELNKPATMAAHNAVACELEDAIIQANALNWLLEISLCYLKESNPSPTIAAGIASLSGVVFNRLRGASSAVRGALTGKQQLND
jgi:hypothetical protein